MAEGGEEGEGAAMDGEAAPGIKLKLNSPTTGMLQV